MKIKNVLFIILLLSWNIVEASPITLKCTTDTGEKTVDLILDVSKHKMKWGLIEYDIVNATDTYITAYQKRNYNADAIGGEVWVLNRITGSYKRASVGIFFDKDQRPENGSFEAFTFEGRCLKQQF